MNERKDGEKRRRRPGLYCGGPDGGDETTTVLPPYQSKQQVPFSFCKHLNFNLPTAVRSAKLC